MTEGASAPAGADAGALLHAPAWASTKVLQGDCLPLLEAMPAASVDLAYLDPPFATGRVHRGHGRLGPTHGFDDRWPSLQAYLDFMEPRIRQVHRVLRPQGSILLHCDWRTSHRLRVMLDEVFGPERFLNHLVWVYGLGGSGPRSFSRKHDDILFYARGPAHWFQAPRVPATSRRLAGRTKKATDVLEIPAINNMAAERCGWPTQKPLALLSLLIGACCPPRGTVLDPFCGSGTTLVAAVAGGRSGIGMDRSPRAVSLALSRLRRQANAPGAPAPARPAGTPPPSRSRR